LLSGDSDEGSVGVVSSGSVKTHGLLQVWGVVSQPEVWLVLVMLLGLGEMSWLSVARYRGYNVAMGDLGTMIQAIWSVSQGQPLVFTAHGVPMSRLARHVELFFFVPALLYRLLPRPETLLVFQALLYVLGAWPLYVLSRRRLASGWLALGFAVVYLLYPVAQTAVLWDFHGDTLAMPLLAFALEALDRRAWNSYGLWLVLSLSCKVYVAIPVVALGVVCWLRGGRRVGVWTALLAAAWGAIAFFGVRSAFAPASPAQVGATTASYVARYFGDPSGIVSTAGARFLTAFVVWAPALWLGWRAPVWLLPAAAVALPMLVSSGPGSSFVYWYHHYALTVPFFLAASIYGAESFQQRRRDATPWVVGIAVMITFLFNVQFVDSPLNPGFYDPGNPFGTAYHLTSPAYAITPRDRFKDAWLERHIPPRAAVAANTFLAPHVANRRILYLTRGQPAVRGIADFHRELDVVATDALMDVAFEDGGRVIRGGVLYEQEAVRYLLQSEEFGLVRSDDGLLLFQPGAEGLEQSFEVMDRDRVLAPKARFDDVIGLVDARVELVGRGRFRLTCDWVALSPRVRDTTYVAVSQPLGLEHARVVHLPTYALLPTPDWPAHSMIRESFEFAVPEEAPPGTYPLVVGWYDAANPTAAETDERSRLGETIQLGTLHLTD
jgi:uncharacterized membrane protein